MTRLATIALGAALVVALVVAGVGILAPGGSDPEALLDAEPATDPPSDANVTAFDSLSADNQRLFERAVEDSGGVPIPSPEAVDRWHDTTYVRYDGTVYRALVAEE